MSTLAAGRRLAKCGLMFQLTATALVAGVLLSLSTAHALGALVGGLGMAAGSLAAASIGLQGLATSADLALLRLVLGQVLKWVLVAATLAVGIAVLKMPALAVLAGLVVAMLAFNVAAVVHRV